MDPLPPRCAGSDVHRADAVVCARGGERPGQASAEVRAFSAMTRDRSALSDRPAGHGVSHGARESTGADGEPVVNLPGGRSRVPLVNAGHSQQVPGRKTAVQDCQWTARLLRPGRLKAGFVPPGPVRVPRDLTRRRPRPVAGKAAAANRTRKALGGATTKLAGVATDVPGACDGAPPL